LLASRLSELCGDGIHFPCTIPIQHSFNHSALFVCVSGIDVK
jgi:hypothetical protein